MSKTKQKRTPAKRDAALAVLLTGGTHEDAARAAGVRRATISDWMREPAFVARLEAAGDEAIKAASRNLRRLAAKAVSVLGEELDSDKGETRLRAAELVLKRILELSEHSTEHHKVQAVDPRLREMTTDELIELAKARQQERAGTLTEGEGDDDADAE